MPLARGLLPLDFGLLPLDVGLLAKRGLPLPFDPLLRPLRALGAVTRGTTRHLVCRQLALVCGKLTFICNPFALVGQCFAAISDPGSRL
jgi:hypothetical protein